MKRRVNICTAIRQGSRYAASFFHQLRALTGEGYEICAVTVALDGDHLVDKTLKENTFGIPVNFVFEGPRGEQAYFMKERSLPWAKAVNLALENSLATPSEFTLWIESDLSFPLDLIELLVEPRQDIVAPVIMLGENFYDSWGFRDLSGQRINTLAELKALPRGPGPLTELSSVGSCLLFRSELLACGLRLPVGYENGLLVGFCKSAKSKGFRVFCRHDVVIVHPTSLWQEQVYRITSCRLGNEANWHELAPAEGLTVAGPYFDFLIPNAVKLITTAFFSLKEGSKLTFATNTRREIALLISQGDSKPPLPDRGFGSVSPSQLLPEVDKPNKPWKLSWWKSVF
jgi:hypothetical protein